MTKLPIKPFFSPTGTAGACGSLVIICKWSRPTLFCIRQEKFVTSATVAYIEQRFGGLVFLNELLTRIWCSVMLSLWFAERTGWLEAGRTTATTDLIVLTFSKRLHLGLFVYVLTIVSPSVFACCLSAYLPAYLENVFHSVYLQPICHVTFMFLFVCLSASRPSVIRVCCRDISLTHSD